MPRDGAEMPFVRTGLDDLADLLDHVLELGVGGVVVRADPDPRAGAEVAEDLPLRELFVHGRELVDVDGDGAASSFRIARARDPEAGLLGEADQQSVWRSELARIRSTPISSIRS